MTRGLLIALLCFLVSLANGCSKHTQAPAATSTLWAWPYAADQATYDEKHLSQQERDYIEHAKEEVYPRHVWWAMCHHRVAVIIDNGKPPSRDDFEFRCNEAVGYPIR